MLQNEEGETSISQVTNEQVAIQYTVPTYSKFKYLANIGKKLSTGQFNGKETQKANPANNNLKKGKGNTTKSNILPIVVPGLVKEYTHFCKEIREAIGSTEFRIWTNSKETRIYTNNEEDRSSIITAFKTHNVAFHTYTNQKQKTKKVLQKAAPGMETQGIISELGGKGVKIKNCTNLKGKKR